MNTAITTESKIIEAKAKAFSTESPRTYSFMLLPGGEVKVYDDVAGYYTSCHSLSLSAQRRILEMAKGD